MASKVNYTREFRVEQIIDYISIVQRGYVRKFDYTSAPFVLNNEAEFDAIVWLDVEPKPTWYDIVTSSVDADNWHYMIYQDIIDLYVECTTILAPVSHTHNQSDVSTLVSDL